jgi:hypothetical protein
MKSDAPVHAAQTNLDRLNAQIFHASSWTDQFSKKACNIIRIALDNLQHVLLDTFLVGTRGKECNSVTNYT